MASFLQGKLEVTSRADSRWVIVNVFSRSDSGLDVPWVSYLTLPRLPVVSYVAVRARYHFG
jgi:hypothetical protein